MVTSHERLRSTKFTIFFGDFNAHVETDNRPWKRGIGKHGRYLLCSTYKEFSFISLAVNENNWYFSQLCCSSGLCFMNTFFKRRGFCKYTRCKLRMTQKSSIRLLHCFVDLLSEVLEVRRNEEPICQPITRLCCYALYKIRNLGETENRVGPIWLT